MQNSYPAKLLLFGEYLVLRQGAALAVPDERYSTYWEHDEKPDADLITYFNYLKGEKDLQSYLHFPRLEKHLNSGWQLKSDIPRNKGLGSSASIVAAIYDRYKKIQDSELSLDELQSVFSMMEGYMHGKSSGFDPLPIYFHQPALRKNNQSVLVDSQLPCLDSWRFELIDSGHVRQDSKGITRYLERIDQDKNFASKIDTLTKVNNKLVEAIIKNEKRIAENLLKTFTENQFYLFADWIPESIREAWENTMDQDDVVYKILGAGGGGYFLKIHLNQIKPEE